MQESTRNLVGRSTQALLVGSIGLRTPVVSQIVAHTESIDGGPVVHFHIVSDCGMQDTVVKWLQKRVQDELGYHYNLECRPGFETWRWMHTGKNDGLPFGAQLLYVRPEPALPELQPWARAPWEEEVGIQSWDDDPNLGGAERDEDDSDGITIDDVVELEELFDDTDFGDGHAH